MRRREAEKFRHYYQTWRKHNVKEKAGFFPVFNDFKEFLKQLSPGAIQLYLYLGIHSGNWTGESYHDLETMAEFFGVSERTIRNRLNELEEAKLIRRMQLRPNSVSHTFLLPYPATFQEVDTKLSAQKEVTNEDA